MDATRDPNVGRVVLDDLAGDEPVGVGELDSRRGGGGSHQGNEDYEDDCVAAVLDGTLLLASRDLMHT